MSIEARIHTSALQDRLKGFAENAILALRSQLYAEVGMLASYIQREKLSGQILKNRKGHLRRSIFHTVTNSGSQIVGTVGVGLEVPYGRYQEYGAQIPERVPVKAKALRWYVGGSPVFAMRARAFTLPARPFMRPSLDEKADEITQGLQQALNEAAQK